MTTKTTTEAELEPIAQQIRDHIAAGTPIKTIDGYAIYAIQDWDGEGWETYLNNHQKILSFEPGFEPGYDTVALDLHVCEADRGSHDLGFVEVATLPRGKADQLFYRMTETHLYVY